jgi:threonine synthase
MLSFVHAKVSALGSRPRVALSPKTKKPRAHAVKKVATKTHPVVKAVIHENITTLIGNTPTIKISDKLCPPGVEMYVKAEYFNPLSSVKDRLALAVIEDAERKGTLKPGMTVVEATSGNTGTFTTIFSAAMMMIGTCFDPSK